MAEQQSKQQQNQQNAAPAENGQAQQQQPPAEQQAAAAKAEVKTETKTEPKAEPSPLDKAKAEAAAAKAEADKEIAGLKKSAADAQDRYIRLMAEFDNFRRRSAKEQVELIETANAKLLGKLSEVLDNFERAFDAGNKAQDLAAFEKGMQLIHAQFEKILKDAGLEQVDPIGKPFDPNFHEALMSQPSESVPQEHVAQVFQKGYKIKNKLLKTAKVIVSSGPAKQDASK